jgi:hypothetical protein
MPTVFTISFDLTTGNVVNLAERLPRELPYSKAMIHTPVGYFEGNLNNGNFPYMEYFDEYTPEDGTIINSAWLLDDMLGMYITEPTGRELQVFYYGEWN